MNEEELFAPPTEDELFEAPTQEELEAYTQLSDEEKRAKAQAEFEEFNKEVQPLEAAVHHAAPSATLGLSDVVAGAAGAAGHAYGSLRERGELPDKKDLLETYYQARQDEENLRAKAMEEQPAASIAGMVGGGFLTAPGASMVAKGVGKASTGLGRVAGAALPNLQGADKIAKAGKIAERAKRLGDYGKFKKYSDLQRKLALQLSLKEGAKAGAISGGTMGQSKLLEGDVGGFIEDVTTGGALGAGLGGGFTAGTQATGKIIKKLPFIRNAIDSFKFGSKGIDLNEAEVNHNINKAAREFIEQFDERLNKISADKDEIYNMLDDLGVTINTKEDLQKARQIVNNIDSDAHRKKAQQFLDVLDDYLGDGKAIKRAQDSLEKKISKYRYQDPVEEARVKLEKRELKEAIESGKVPVARDDAGVVGAEDILPDETLGSQAQVQSSLYQEINPETGKPFFRNRLKAENLKEFKPSNIQRSVDPETGREVAYFKDFGTGKVHTMVGNQQKALNSEKLTTQQARRLKDLLNEYSQLAKSENLPQDVKRAATEAAKLVDQKIGGAAKSIGKPLENLNKKMSNLLSAKERIGIGRRVTQNDKDDAVKAMAKFIAGIGDNNPVEDKNLVLQRLKEADPRFANQIAEELNTLRRQYELANINDDIANTTNFASALLGKASTIWNKSFNLLGQASTAPMRVSRAAADATKRTASNALANTSLNISDASKAQIQGLINKVSESGNKVYNSYLGPLRKALNSPTRTKQSIMYGLYQQPAFREMIEAINEEETQKDQEK